MWESVQKFQTELGEIEICKPVTPSTKREQDDFYVFLANLLYVDYLEQLLDQQY